jgi:hypothetical protein
MSNPAPSEWYCDVCGQKVTAKDGYIVWDSRTGSGFEIIHRGRCDARKKSASNELAMFLDDDGKAYLLTLLSHGPLMNFHRESVQNPTVNLADWTDLFHRLHTPRYEEARRYFDRQDVRERFDDANEWRPYMQDALQVIIEMGERGN